MKNTYVYHNHKYHPIHVDLFTDYFKDVQNGNVDPLLTTIQLLKMQLNKIYPSDYDPLNPYNITLSSATLSRITNITNKYLSDKRIYIPVLLEKPNYYYSIARGSGKSIRELCYVAKVISNYSSYMLSTTYSPEYTAQNYKSDIENLYKKIISEKILNSYITQNNATKQRSNNQEEMSCFKFIANKSNTNKKFHK